MSKVITFSRVFPKCHPKSGRPTGFVKSMLHQQGVLINEDYKKLILKLNQEKILAGKLSFADIILFLEDLKKEDEPFYDKIHTIRIGSRFMVGEKFSPRVWSAKPYASPQIIFYNDLEIKKLLEFRLEPTEKHARYFVNNKEMISIDFVKLSKNDCLEPGDFEDWFQYKKMSGQVICWDDVSY